MQRRLGFIPEAPFVINIITQRRVFDISETRLILLKKMEDCMYSSVNTIWVLVAAALVFFMQAGFAMVETGFTRAKNAGNIIMKNLMDFSLGTPFNWL
jgi:hypothetical protein